MVYDYIICHYGEIGLKGENRKFFEDALRQNIERALKRSEVKYEFVKRISGRIIVKLNEKESEDSDYIETDETEKALKASGGVLGVSYYAKAVYSEQDITAIKKTALEILSKQKFETFRITTQRSNKNFSLTSQQINETLGEHIMLELNKKVMLKKPDLTCFIEIVDDYAFLYLEKNRGIGGLPVGVSGKAAALLSGGIDSPVAAFYAMKRGAKVIFMHFHSFPYTGMQSIEKVKKMAKILNKFQFKSKLFLIPFAEIQEEILMKTEQKNRIVLYRRFMLRIAEKIAGQEKALALITGDSLGQVASQTMENISVIEEAVKIPILRPLIGFDKEEIILKAKEIETYEISIQPHLDCCVRFIPKHPATKAKIEEITEAEKNLDAENLIRNAIEKTEILEI